MQAITNKTCKSAQAWRASYELVNKLFIFSCINSSFAEKRFQDIRTRIIIQLTYDGSLTGGSSQIFCFWWNKHRQCDVQTLLQSLHGDVHRLKNRKTKIPYVGYLYDWSDCGYSDSVFRRSNKVRKLSTEVYWSKVSHCSCQFDGIDRDVAQDYCWIHGQWDDVDILINLLMFCEGSSYIPSDYQPHLKCIVDQEVSPRDDEDVFWYKYW